MNTAYTLYSGWKRNEHPAPSKGQMEAGTQEQGGGSWPLQQRQEAKAGLKGWRRAGECSSTVPPPASQVQVQGPKFNPWYK